LTTSETGTSASFTVALMSQPTAPVTISLDTTQAGQGSLSQSKLIFDAGNWNIAQTVTVTGLDDYQLNGDQSYQITGVAASADGHYDGLSMAPVTVVNKEADTSTFLVTSETGTSASF